MAGIAAEAGTMERNVYYDYSRRFPIRQIGELEKILNIISICGTGTGVSTDRGELFIIVNSGPQQRYLVRGRVGEI